MHSAYITLAVASGLSAICFRDTTNFRGYLFTGFLIGFAAGFAAAAFG